MPAIWEHLLNLLYPPCCVACRRRGALLCAACAAACRPLPSGGWSRTSSPALAGVCGLYLFDSAMRDAIHALKYDRVKGMARPLALLMATQLRRGRLLPDQAALAWVPLHSARADERGFNQAELLARHLAGSLGLALAPGLVRLRATSSQVGMKAESRRANVRDAFQWTAAAPPPARVVVIDDVLTTGSTLEACASALRASGAREVYGLALATA